MNFKEFLDRLDKGETVEQITQGTNVECIKNEVYVDDDLNNFLKSIGAEIEEFGVGYAIIGTKDNEYYELPYEERPNRFDKDLPDETILFFEPSKIYDITQ